MDERAQIYKRYIPDLVQTENGYLVGCCPFCKEEYGFVVEPTNDFLCLKCNKEGSLEDFVRILGGDETEPREAESSFRSEIVDNIDFGRFFQQDQKIFAEKREKGSQESSDTKVEAILSSILKMDLPGRELRIFLLLHLGGGGLTAKEISEKLQILQTNVHRYLSAVEKKGLIYSTGKPRHYFRTEDAERQN